MAGVGEDVAQLAVAPHTAAVLGWAGSPAGEADGVLDAVGWEDVLDEQVVLPGVAEVVGVAQPGTGTDAKLEQPDPGFVGDVARQLKGRAGEAAAVDLEGVQVGVLPAEHCLYDLVQLGQGGRGGQA